MLPIMRLISIPVVFVGLAAFSAVAQIQLPGAFAPAPAGSVQQPATAQPRKPGPPPGPVASSVNAPGEEAIVGRRLHLNGKTGTVEFDYRDKALKVARLVLAGEGISKPAEACEVNVVAASLSPRQVGRPEGLLRYEMEVEACPFRFDILDGAVLTSSQAPICEFKAADCKVTPSGLWGPNPGNLVGDQLKAIEKARTTGELATRTNFKALLAQARDKTEVKRIAGEQAAFSSKRETICRDYAMESAHGFCATRLTQAHAASLKAQIDAANAGAKSGRAEKKK